MPLDLTGISNVNEFYSHHYLDALLGRDIKALLSRWVAEEEESGTPGPHRRLARCAQEYFRTKARTAETATAADRFEETHGLNVLLAEALGYTHQAQAYELLEEGQIVPVLASLCRDGQPYLWLLEGTFPDPDNPVLEQMLASFRHPQEAAPDIEKAECAEEQAGSLPSESWEALAALIFRCEQPPRWLVLMAGSEIYLIERHKWGQGQYLLFDIDAILGRVQADTIGVVAALLARDALCPEEGTVLHDALDDSSHKHAFAVSEDLKFGIRRAVELLGNEYIHYQRTVARGALYEDEALAQRLTGECLTYLYRLLFLLYAEARGGEVDVVPMKSDEYRLGYSLESLRDLELVPLTTTEAQDGHFIDTSLRQLFRMVNEGWGDQGEQYGLELGQWGDTLGLVFSNRDGAGENGGAPGAAPEYLDHGFAIRGLDSALFDPKRTPLLSSVRFRNSVLQQAIQLLSLSREGGRRERGRISYAQLGINQLGAVYEGLLSYSGFFAQEPLYEVKSADTKAGDETQQSYFVPESEVGQYEPEEFVYEDGGSADEGRRRKRYERGSFVFRLAGRDREKSASYYTPEVLTQCVVRYSLKELLAGRTADEILELTICEPAMGSGAFLNEAVNQLADAYLERKQRELGQDIVPSDYPHERQKVKAYLATHNCYGVDLNPTAVDLARVSLWLNTIYPGSRCPWFGLRLAVGNSLIGARRQVYKAGDIQRKGSKAKPNWLGLIPEVVPVGPEWAQRPAKSVYHFLLPAEGMAAFDKDKVIRELAVKQTASIREWRKEFSKPFDRAEAHKLVELSDAADELWQQVIRERQLTAIQTAQAIAVWGQEGQAEEQHSTADQEARAAELGRPYTAYRRLKLVMDYWCALWFWPIQEAEGLPSRDTYLMDLELILRGTVTAKVDESLQLGLFAGEPVSDEHKEFIRHHGLVDVDELCEKVERLRIVKEAAERVRFHHWELRFAEVSAEGGGFDLILGNPPWVLLSFDEAGVLADRDALVAVRKLSAKQVADRRKEAVERQWVYDAYLDEFATQTGTQEFLGSPSSYPLLTGMKANLYKCFITRAWDIGSAAGVTGLLHPEGVYDDPKGGSLRAALYTRSRMHFQFINELKLFADVDHHAKFSVNVYARGQRNGTVSSVHMSNLFHPSTIDASLCHDGAGGVPGIKTSDNEWSVLPHRSRLIRIGRNRLETLARLYDAPGTPPLQARLPVVHSEEIVSVLEKFAEQPRRLGDLEGEYFATQHWNETNAQQDGTIRRETRYPEHAGEWILSGPHFFVGTPLNKTPNEGCKNNLDYSSIDLTAIPDDYLPRTNYVPACSPEEYLQRTPKWNGRPVTEFYRHVHREMVSPTGERTLVPCIVPPRIGHVHTVFALCFRSDEDLVRFSGLASSIVYDFYVKSMGAGHVNVSHVRSFPIPDAPACAVQAAQRVLSLHAGSAMYADLRGALGSSGSQDALMDLDRRRALIELDTLAAHALDLTEDELVTIYRVQFPVLQQNERTNRYDQTGRLVPGAVLKLAEKLNIDTREPLQVSQFRGDSALVGEVDTLTLGITGGIRWEDPKMEPRMERVYLPPFARHDREADMREAYRTLAEQLRHAD